MKLLNKKNFWVKGASAIAVLLICIFILPITAKADTPGTVNDNNVNIRSDADATSTSVGKVNSGDKVTIIEEKTNSSNVLWYKITTATGTTGYIRADFITKSTTDNTNTTTTTTDTTTTTTTTQSNVTNIDSKAAYIAGDVVNIRSQASASSDLVAKAQKNAEVTVTGETTASDGYKWYKVTFTADGATKTGFIRSDLLTFTKPTNPPAETNIDSNNQTDTPDTATPDTTETPDAGTETGENPEVSEPVEAPAETTAEPKKMITALQPAEAPEYLPEGFVEGQLESGEKVWSKGDYFIVYGLNEKNITGWYILDEKNNTYISYENLISAPSKSSSSDMKVFGINIKVILVVLIILIILLLGVVFFMALKLSRGVENDDDYDYDDYEDEEEEEEIPVSSIENSRSRRSSESRSSRSDEREPKQSKAAKAKDKFLNYFTTEVDDEADDDEYYDDVDEDDDDIDFIDI